jgi:methylenetetrahydrofolate reductase (NADPH)
MNLCELVPRDLESFVAEAKEIVAKYPEVKGINVPDVHRLDVRSYNAADSLLDEGVFVVPHIRAIDNPIEVTVAILSRLVKKGLTHVLIITGDTPINISAKTYPVKVVDLVKTLKAVHPDLKVYCAVDPYRQSFQKELTYCKEKIEAGADGFFSQPFFDPKLAEIYIEQLGDVEFFVGLSPVTSENSYNYWIVRNKAIFPHNFETTMEFNCELGKDVVAMAKKHAKNTYLMPIKNDPNVYLAGLFGNK